MKDDFKKARQLAKQGEGRYRMDVAFGVNEKDEPATSWKLVYVNPTSKEDIVVINQSKYLESVSHYGTYPIKST